MAAIRSYMLSFLSVRAMTQGAQFAKQFPGSWLVWEPGPWRAPAGNTGQQTLVGTADPQGPVPGDALCFHLQGGGDTGSLRLGRLAENNDLVLNDATVSRTHALLTRTGADAWSVSPAKSRPVLVDGRPVAPGSSAPLRRASGLVLGSVRLTWYDAEGFQARLREALKSKLA